MKIALHQITTLNAPMEEDLKAYAEAGFSAFELHLGKAKKYLETHSLHALRDLVRAAGLQPVGATGHVVSAFAAEDARHQNREEFVQALEIMEALACPLIVFGGDGPAENPVAAQQSEAGLAARDMAYTEALVRFAAEVGHLADLAAPRGISMALEMNWCRLCRSVQTAARTLDLVGRANVGFLFDAAHFAVSPSRLSDLDLVKGRIIYGHLDDMRPCPPDLTNVNNDRVIPGDGALPLHEWYQKIEACGYTGWHAVELFCHDLWQEPALQIARKVKAGCQRVWPAAQF
ncbi:MAG: sugar phosphate isomerase/epimerase [Candidatus Latescibacteria bacterium]|nr:sugar phosphate isomerase/epimerase [Candidatus Latescibacterota bacterium]